tara:strand:+ start:211 stop:489 length:279 start_codon:yes stop_codon:yes gene_type:complete
MSNTLATIEFHPRGDQTMTKEKEDELKIIEAFFDDGTPWTKEKEDALKIIEALKIIDDVITREVIWADDCTCDIEQAWAILQQYIRKGELNS